MRTECQDFLTALGFVCFTCYDHEAEAMCANLSSSGRTTATVSEDLDTIVFGDAPLLRHFFSRTRPILSIDPIIARDELGLSRDAFVDLCILCGTDFSGTIKGIGPHRALQWIKKYDSIENILEHIASTKHVPQPTFDYQLARDVFNNLPPISENESDYFGTKQSQSFVDDMLGYYEIDPVKIDLRLGTDALAQKLSLGQEWNMDPFNNDSNNDIFINNKLLL